MRPARATRRCVRPWWKQARSAARTKTYLGAQYRRLARRIGANRAAMAVAHSMAVMLHTIIKTKRPFADLGVRLLHGA